MKNMRSWFNYLFPKTNTSSTTVGIDLNTSAIRIAALHQENQIPIVNLVEIPIDPMTQSSTIIASAIKTSLKQMSLRIKNVIIAVPDSAVISKIIQLDQGLTESEIAQHINLETEHYFQQTATKLCFDFALLGTSNTAPNKIDVQLTAAWRKEVDYRRHLIHDAGLAINAIDIESQALLRLLQYQKQTQNSAVVLLEQDYFLLTLVAQGAVVQTYTEHFSATCPPAQLAEQINNQLQLMLATQRINNIKNVYVTGCYQDLFATINCLNATNYGWNTNLLSFDFLPKDKLNFVVAAGLALWDWPA